MAKIEFTVQAQRSDGRGYQPCEIHRATSFAVIRTERFTRSGRRFTASRVVSRFATKSQADGEVKFLAAAVAPTPRHLVRKLGQRIIRA